MMLFVLSADRSGAKNQPPATTNTCAPRHPNQAAERQKSVHPVKHAATTATTTKNYLHAAPVQAAAITPPLNEAFSGATHSEPPGAEREFRRRDLFTWSCSALLIGGGAGADPGSLARSLARTCTENGTQRESER